MLAYSIFTRFGWHDFATFGHICLQSNILPFFKQFWTVLVSNLCQTVRNQALKSMGFSARGVWVTGYCGCMGYGVLFPANQLGGLKNLWDLRDYGLSQPWVKRELTVHGFHSQSLFY
jgi:hypothetical protein